MSHTYETQHPQTPPVRSVSCNHYGGTARQGTAGELFPAPPAAAFLGQKEDLGKGFAVAGLILLGGQTGSKLGETQDTMLFFQGNSQLLCRLVHLKLHEKLQCIAGNVIV